MSVGNNFKGAGTLHGPAAFGQAATPPSFTYSYSFVSGDALGCSIPGDFFWVGAPKSIDSITAGTVITISGVTGVNAGLNGKSFTSDNVAGGVMLITNGGTLYSEWTALGLPSVIGSGSELLSAAPGLTFNWN